MERRRVLDGRRRRGRCGWSLAQRGLRRARWSALEAVQSARSRGGGQGHEGKKPQHHHAEATQRVGRQGQFATPLQDHAVGQLKVLRGKRGGEFAQRHCVGVVLLQAVRQHLQHGEALQQGGQILQGLRQRQRALVHGLRQPEQRLRVTTGQGAQNIEQIAGIDGAQHLPHAFRADPPGVEGDGLVRQGQRIAHRTAGRAAQGLQRRRFEVHALGPQHLLQVLRHRRRRHRLERELKAAAQHRHGHLLRIGGGQHEHHLLRRFLQRLQHGVEGVVGQHVHFIDHVDLEAAGRGLVDGLLEQAGHVVHAAVGGRVQFDVVDEAPGIDLQAGGALAAGLGGDVTLPVGTGAVERLRQDARDRGLADAAGAGEQIGVVQAAALQRMGERAHHMILSDQGGEGLGAPFARQHGTRHGKDCKGRPRHAAARRAYNRPRRAAPHCGAVNLVRPGTEQPQPFPASAGGTARHPMPSSVALSRTGACADLELS